MNFDLAWRDPRRVRRCTSDVFTDVCGASPGVVALWRGWGLPEVGLGHRQRLPFVERDFFQQPGGEFFREIRGEGRADLTV